jgi:hypothetical protein
LAGDDIEMSSEGHENRKVKLCYSTLEMLKLVVVWCWAGDDVEMSSEGHENRKG